MTFEIHPVAFVRSSRVDPIDDGWNAVTSVIELAEGVPGESLDGLDAFSHVEVLYVFDRVAEDAIETGARRPRGNPAWPRVGIFAQRGKNRPNRLGATICRIARVEARRVHVAGLDAIDGTPVVDLKPVMKEFLPAEATRQPAWATELMQDYWTASGADLSRRLPGTWCLQSRIDMTRDGRMHPDPALGSDAVALLIYDRAGHFSAQFMKRDRDTAPADGPAGAANNTQAQGGYDAYFGTYRVDEAAGVVTQTLQGALSRSHVGAVLSRAMNVEGDALVIRLETTAWDGTPVTRTLTWERVG
jgi:tRNA-Thr(GGU) m(6)t(6)A37 methyltransferase TsaA